MADPLGSVEKIVKVALMIKEAVDKVRKNKECREIRKRVVRVSALLTRLQETQMTKDPATSSALKELEETLTVAHELVTACQRKNVLMSRFCTAGDLAEQLREVKQDISDLMVDGIFATNVNTTILLTHIQLGACTPPQKVSLLAYVLHNNPC
ncbi:hypothetical protein BAE44_0021381 [Dichanthelium oligosanthes]|uniref:Mixed lineage kinase domain-containing protein n=1 Tax=Dichanthelium oligosanthes TaxID=888268 RepID=A0A1E5UXI2_9POAL|nr:hypothetical protein BAE44_0021381 [Dichanthelium oligosanthes]